MTTPLFSSGSGPLYHEGMLVLKTRPEVRRLAAVAMNGASRSAAVANSPGLSALTVLERAGRIKRITPLSRSAERAVPRSAGRSFAALVASQTEAESDLNAGVCLLEAERDEDLPELQLALANDPEVEYVSRVPVRYLLVSPYPEGSGNESSGGSLPGSGAGIAAVPPPASTMWNLLKIQWAEARRLPAFQEAQGIRVAVLDSGIDEEHVDLQGRIEKYVFDHPLDSNASSDRDFIGHGTHVAGTIAAVTGNGVGINGICACDLFIWKIFDDKPDFDRFAREFVYYVDPLMYLRALADCVEERVHVVNLSIGGPGAPDEREAELFDMLLDNGTIVVAAMGNERRLGSPTSYPAAVPGVIAVGATTINDTVADFSNQGAHIALSAPGVAIWSTLPSYPGQFGFDAVRGPGGTIVPGMAQARETDYDAWQGTSMAAPHVAGAVALLLANKGAMSPSDVRTHLQASADKVPEMKGRNFTSDHGAGRLNLLRLLR